MKALIVAVAMCVLAPSALALLDDGQDSLGCYFDDQGGVNCFDQGPSIWVTTRTFSLALAFLS
jgi:hypothetical protein